VEEEEEFFMATKRLKSNNSGSLLRAVNRLNEKINFFYFSKMFTR
jgi:hypothetical protein